MSAQARNIIMGMERYGKEVKSTGSVNEMDVVSEGEGEEMTSKIFTSLLLVGWFSVTGNTREGLNVEDWVGYYYFRYHLIYDKVIKFSECDDFF